MEAGKTPILAHMTNVRIIAKKLVRFLPEILIGVFAMALVVFAPLPIWDDGTQFETLARSILRGEYALTPGVPSMYREPGYPLFRALVYAIGGTPHVVLILQAILAVLTCFLWRRIWDRIKPGTGWIGAWGTTIAYGYWLFSRQHAYEVLLGFLMACGMFLFQKFWTERKLPLAIASGLVFGLLSATRGVFIFLAFPLIAYVLLEAWPQRKKIWPGLLAFLLCAGLFPIGWMLRNQIQFHTFSIASRPGLVLLARAIKTDATWGQYGASFVGTFTGDALIKAVLPDWKPIDRQHTATLDLERERIAAEAGLQPTDSLVDELMLTEAKNKIFRSRESFAKYAAWTVIDDIRLVSIPSFTTPWGTMEPMFLQAQKLSLVQIIFLLVSAGLNLVWLVGGFVGCLLFWRTSRPHFYLAIPYLYLLLVHAPLDNTVRFSATIQPIIGALVLLSLHSATSFIRSSRPILPPVEMK